MSVWTHVCGLVYIDHFNFTNNVKEADYFGVRLKNKFLKEVPTGIEGPLHIEVLKGACSGSASIGENEEFVDVSYRWVVAIWGDLRGFKDIESIKSWLDKCVKNLDVRQGIVEIECEDGRIEVWNIGSSK